MIPFQTTPEQIVNLAGIMVEMRATNLGANFIAAAFEIARTDQGVYDLMEMWSQAKADPEGRDEIIADLQEMIDEYDEAPREPLKKPYIKFEKLGDVADNIVARKAQLRLLIDRAGGVSAVALKSGIPQPSLSRMLSSASMPRKSTLFKIADALQVGESDIVAEWTR